MASVFRADLIGSLQRPDYLIDAANQHGAGKLSVADFKRIEDRAVDQAIALQEALGFEVVTDGEQRRKSYRDWLVNAVEGLSQTPAYAVTLRGLPGHADLERRESFTISGKLRLKRSVSVEEFAYARARTSKPLKITLPHPMHCLLHYGDATRSVYPDPFELFEDAALLVQQECRELVAVGCEHIQIDSPIITWALDAHLREHFFPTRGILPDRFLQEAVRLLDVIADVPGAEFSVHLCRGNAPTHYFSAGGYDEAAKFLFGQSSKISKFLLEYDDWRAGSFAALAHVPRDKFVVLGLVASTKTQAVEPAEQLIERVNEASRYFPLERMGISSQCGFCSAVGSHGFPASIQEAKLKRIVEVARRIWH